MMGHFLFGNLKDNNEYCTMSGTKSKISHRIIFDKEDMEFMKDYKDVYGTSIQAYVNKAVKAQRAAFELKLKLKSQADEISTN